MLFRCRELFFLIHRKLATIPSIATSRSNVARSSSSLSSISFLRTSKNVTCFFLPSPSFNRNDMKMISLNRILTSEIIFPLLRESLNIVSIFFSFSFFFLHLRELKIRSFGPAMIRRSITHTFSSLDSFSLYITKKKSFFVLSSGKFSWLWIEQNFFKSVGQKVFSRGCYTVGKYVIAISRALMIILWYLKLKSLMLQKNLRMFFF